MKAVILAGGLGTRLGEETEARPKPMVLIGDRPIIWHIMKISSAYGLNDSVVCLSNLKLDSSKARLRLGWRPRWAFEDTIARTTEWYKARTEGRNMRDVTRHQITSYLAAPGI